MEDAIATGPVSEMTRHQKLAALLVILGPESAAQMLKNLEEQELESVAMEMSRLTFITQELREEILREFSALALQAGTAVLGGVTYTRSVLEKAVGPLRTSNIIGRLSPAPVPARSVASAPIRQIADMDPGHLYNLLKDEQPQTVALVASCLAAENTSRLLTLFPDAKRGLILERLATLGPTPVEVVESIAGVLGRKRNVKPARVLNQGCGLKIAADAPKAADRNLGGSPLADPKPRHPKPAQAADQNQYAHEELPTQGSDSPRRVPLQVDMRGLAPALKNASPKLQDALREEMALLGSLRPRDAGTEPSSLFDIVPRVENNIQFHGALAAPA